MLDLLVIGDCFVDQHLVIENTDVFTEAETGEAKFCFFHGSKIPVNDFKTTFGGNAAHVSIGAKRLGLNSAIYTELGDDMYSDQLLKLFEKEQVETKYCKTNPGTNTNTSVIIIFNQERTIFNFHQPRNYTLPFEQIPIPNWIYYTSLSKGFEKFQPKLVDFIKANSDIGVACNPGSIHLKNLDQVTPFFKVTDVLFVNKDEARRITNVPVDKQLNPVDLHKEVQMLGPRLTVITDGKNGSSVYDGNELYEQPAPQVSNVVDKTGAGDAYSAAFLSALHHKKTIREAMEWGNKNAASIVAQIGAIDGLVSLKEVE